MLNLEEWILLDDLKKELQSVQVTQVKFSMLACSSEDTFAKLMDSVTRQIHQDSLHKLIFNSSYEKYRMESHSLSQYAYKAANLKILRCSELQYTTEENRVTLFDMTEKIFSNALTLE